MCRLKLSVEEKLIRKRKHEKNSQFESLGHSWAGLLKGIKYIKTDKKRILAEKQLKRVKKQIKLDRQYNLQYGFNK